MKGGEIVCDLEGVDSENVFEFVDGGSVRAVQVGGCVSATGCNAV